MRTRLSVLACTVVTVATLSGRQSQTPAGSQDSTPVFRTGANLIRVDMYATRDGSLVTDLRPEDVELFEDGVRQKIETFEFVQIGGEATAAIQPLDRLDARTRIYIVFVDTFTARMSDDIGLRRNLLRFIDRTVQPADLVGLMTPDMSAFDVVLGRKNTVMSDLANEERWVGRRSTAPVAQKDFQWENCYANGRRVSRRLVEMRSRRDARDTLASLRELVDRLREIREERKAVLLVSGGWPFDDETALTDGTDQETKTCLEDRKSLLRLNFKSMIKDLARSANRANVSFYPVSSRPLLATPADLPAQLRNVIMQREKRAENEAADQLRDLAEISDGAWEREMRGMERIATRIVDDTSNYYLLGYQSTNTRNDSKYREISIKVNRPGVIVRSRPGYGGEDVRVVKLGTPAPRPLIDTRITTAFENVQRFEPANPMILRTSLLGASAGGGAFWVVGEAGARGQHWDGNSAEVVVSAVDRSEVFSRQINLRGTSDLFNVRVPETGTLPLGNYSVRVRVVRPSDASTPLAQDFFRLDLAAGSGGLGEPVLWRHGPLVRDPFHRTADPRFRRVERLRLEYLTDTSDQPVARLLDRMGQPLPVPVQLSSREEGESGGRWVVADLTLAGLAPGEYAVSMALGQAMQVTAFRVVP